MGNFKNFAVNYLGQGTQLLVLVVATPIYLKFLGTEAYGLIGIYTLIQAWFNLLDLGMSPMLSRSFAQNVNTDKSSQDIANLLRSVEILLVALVAPILYVCTLFSAFFTNNWIKVTSIDIGTLQEILYLFTVIIFMRLFEGIYRSVLVGMEKHFSLNVAISSCLLARTIISVLFLAFLQGDIKLFFTIQLCFGTLTSLILLALVYANMPTSMWTAQFSIRSLKVVYKFSFGMALITILSLLITQVDKIILTAYLSLEEFAYFTLAASVASVLHTLIAPIPLVLSPKLAFFQKADDETEFNKTFIFGSKVISLIICPVGVLLAFYSEQILLIWTQNLEIAQAVSKILPILVIANIFNAMMWMPYQAQVAHAWTSLSIKTNIVSICVLIPSNLILIPMFGAIASAYLWLLLNISYILIGAPIMFSQIMKTIPRKWFIECNLKPLGLSLLIIFASKNFVSIPDNSFFALVVLAAFLIITYLSIYIVAPSLREDINEFLLR